MCIYIHENSTKIDKWEESVRNLNNWVYCTAMHSFLAYLSHSPIYISDLWVSVQSFFTPAFVALPSMHCKPTLLHNTYTHILLHMHTIKSVRALYMYIYLYIVVSIIIKITHRPSPIQLVYMYGIYSYCRISNRGLK